MNRTSAALLTLALALPATAMAQSGPSFTLIAGGDTSVNGDVHKGAIAPIADLGPLNPALAGVSAELQIGARSYDKIYGKGTNFGIEMAWPMGNSDEVFGQLMYTRTGSGSTQVGGAYVPALETTLPVYGRFGSYDALGLEGGYRYYFGSGSVRPYIAGRLGATHVDSIKATFTIPDANIALNDVPFFKSGWQLSGGADLGVMWALTDKTSLGLEVGARYHGNLSGDDSALAGLGLAGINNTGKRTSYPVNLRLQMRF